MIFLARQNNEMARKYLQDMKNENIQNLEHNNIEINNLCNGCSKMFSTKSNLTKHLKVSSNQACSESNPTYTACSHKPLSIMFCQVGLNNSLPSW